VDPDDAGRQFQPPLDAAYEALEGEEADYQG
jgi:hypothetical protein